MEKNCKTCMYCIRKECVNIDNEKCFGYFRKNNDTCNMWEEPHDSPYIHQIPEDEFDFAELETVEG